MFKHKMGDRAKDKISGYEGVITGRCEHITGCNTYGLHAGLDKEGKVRDLVWFDEDRLEVVAEKQVPPSAVAGKKNGGPLSSIPASTRGH